MMKEEQSSAVRRLQHLCPALVIAALLAGAPAATADVKPTAAEIKTAFKAADFDGDSKVSWEEFRNRVVAAFGHLDRNSDGRIAAEEHPPAINKNGETVQPGVVSVEEFTASAQTAFKVADKNSDGKLSFAEWTSK